MFRKLFPFFLGLMLLFSGLSYAENYSPKVGEVLDYKVIVKSFIHGGNQIIKVVSKGEYQGNDIYNIHSEMATIGLAKGIYNYTQVEDLVLDQDGLFPRQVKIEIKEGNQTKQEIIRFDYDAKIAYRNIINNDGAQECVQIPLPGPVQDGLSIIFFLRKNQNNSGTNRIFFYNNSGDISENNFSASQINQPITMGGNTYRNYFQMFDNISNIKVLISNTPERLPFIIKKMADFGSIEMRLKREKAKL